MVDAAHVSRVRMSYVLLRIGKDCHGIFSTSVSLGSLTDFATSEATIADWPFRPSHDRDNKMGNESAENNVLSRPFGLTP